MIPRQATTVDDHIRRVTDELLSALAEYQPDVMLELCDDNDESKATMRHGAVALCIEGESDGRDWHWIVRADSCWMYIVGGCCHTGWDCQGTCEVFRADSQQEAIGMAPDDVKSTLLQMLARGDRVIDNQLDW